MINFMCTVIPMRRKVEQRNPELSLIQYKSISNEILNLKS